MHGDQKLGLALGILLIGVVGAFFFRNETELVTPTSELKDAEWIDQVIDQNNGPKPYPQRASGRMAASDQTRSIPEQADPSTATAQSDQSMPLFNSEPDLAAFDSTPPVIVTDANAVAPQPDDSGSSQADPNSAWQARPDDPGSTLPFSYTVKNGDTLSGLSTLFLGTSSRYLEIFELNRDRMQSENDLRVGMTLRIPARNNPAGNNSEETRNHSTARPVSTPQNVPTPSTGRWPSTEPRTPAKPSVPQEQSAPADPRRFFRPYRQSPLAPRANRRADKTPTVNDGNEKPESANPAPGEISDRPSIKSRTIGESTVLRPPLKSTPLSIRYVIRAGDTLPELARRFLGSAEEGNRIRTANPDRIATRDEPLSPGETLTIP